MLKSIGDALIAFGPLGVFVIGLLDSLGVPLVGGVDALLIYVAVKSPQHGIYCGHYGHGGFDGWATCCLFLGARYGVRRFASEEAPDGKRQKFRLWFQRYGLLTVFIPAVTPFVPLPLKVFVISAGAMRTPLGRFPGGCGAGAGDSLLRGSVSGHTAGRGCARFPDAQRLEYRRHRGGLGAGSGRRLIKWLDRRRAEA